MNNVLIYTRVATTDKTTPSANSYETQVTKCKSFCELRKYDVFQVYKECYSGATFDRPEWKKLISFVKDYKGLINKIVFLDWSRFSRNQYEAIKTIKQLAKLNIEVECIEHPLNLSNPDKIVALDVFKNLPKMVSSRHGITIASGKRAAAERRMALLAPSN